MSDLLGAWSLNEVPPRRQLSDTDLRAVLAQLSGWPARAQEFSGGRLWLVAGTGKVISESDRCLAYEGLIATPDPLAVEMRRFLRSFEAGRIPYPEGQFAMVHGGDALTLIRGLAGGERLYYARLADLVIFSSSLRPLLAHPSIGRRLDEEVIDEVLLTGLTMFGDRSLPAGINEVLPGHVLEVGDGIAAQRWHWNEFLASPTGNLESLARDCHAALGEAVALAAGRDRPVAVTLSGGIDSSAIAALAVEAFGADNVAAFTYEFDDPEHPSETRYAIDVVRKLGIRRHHVFKLGFRDYLAHIPETVWRAEQITHWAKSFMLPAAREIQRHGFERFLSGFGIGSHMAYFGEFARALPPVPRGVADLALAHWRHHQLRDWRWPQYLARLHPGLEPAPPRLYPMMLAILHERGRIADVTRFFPDAMRPLIERLPERVAGALEDRPLAELLKYHSFARLISCVDVTRWEKPLREIGIQRISPAHFASCIPYCYAPISPAPRLWSKERGLRPGKLLVRKAMEGVLPESVLYRRKNWADAVVSRRWSRAGLGWMRQVVGDSAAHLRPEIAGYVEAARQWDRCAPQATVTALGFWHRLFMELPLRAEPPSWADLMASAKVPRANAELEPDRIPYP